MVLSMCEPVRRDSRTEIMLRAYYSGLINIDAQLLFLIHACARG